MDLSLNIPLGVIGFCLGATMLTDPPYMRRTLARLNILGIVLLVVSMTTLQIVLQRSTRDGWFTSPLMTLLLIAIGSLVTLVWWELRTSDPIINLRLLGQTSFLAGIGLIFLFGMFFFGSPFLLPLFLQKLQGITFRIGKRPGSMSTGRWLHTTLAEMRGAPAGQRRLLAYPLCGSCYALPEAQRCARVEAVLCDHMRRQQAA